MAGDDGAAASSIAVGTGPTTASASAVVGPSGPSAAAGTTVDGKPGASAAATAPPKTDDLPACRGSAKWNCCDDKEFTEKDGETVCDCWPGSFGFCNFRVVAEEPVTILEDIFGLNSGDLCRCAPPDVVECLGIVKRECCDEYSGDVDECRCIFGTRCQYTKVSEQPLVWKSTTGTICTCPIPLK